MNQAISPTTALHFILLVFAFVLFVIAVFPVASRFNLIAAGLAFLTASLLFS